MSRAVDFVHRAVLLVAPLLSALLTALLIRILLQTGIAHRLALDAPNARSLHGRPTPRVGGAALLGIALGIAAATAGLPAWLLVGALVLIAVGVVDDRRGLPPGARLAAHAAVAVAATWPLVPIYSLAILVLVSLLIIWSMNAFNFMDGSDGMAGGMTIIGFGTCGLVAAGSGESSLAMLCLCTAGAAAGFLWFNFAPARVFMGDAGSVPLGFLAAATAIEGTRADVWPAWFAPMVFSPFLVDATLTLAARAVAGHQLWQAHREHVYQRAVRSGLGHAKTALLAYGLMAAGAAGAVFALALPPALQWLLVSAWHAALGLLFLALRRRWAQH